MGTDDFDPIDDCDDHVRRFEDFADAMAHARKVAKTSYWLIASVKPQRIELLDTGPEIYTFEDDGELIEIVA